MKIMITTAITAVLASIILISCNSAADPAPVYYEKDNGAIVKSEKGGSFKVMLKGIPTTGYTWEVSKCNTQLITLAGTEYSRDSDLTGAGGVFEWTFNVIGDGASDLEFVYHRPWEKNEKPLKVYKLNIQGF